MYGALLHQSRRALLLVTLVLVALGAAPGRSFAAPARAPRAAQACPATVGVYLVGVSPTMAPGAAPGTGPMAIPYPYASGLRGTITLAGFPACGTAVSGSFSVHLAYQVPPIRSATPGGSAAAPVPSVVVPISNTTVLTATGTFSVDATHSRDPIYVSVSGTITYGRVTYACFPACLTARHHATLVCPEAGCGPMRPTVTSVVTFTGITGYLQVQVSAASTLVLAFLPPPSATTPSPGALTFQPLVLYGRRSGS